jgi:replicative DNA helicase
MNADALELAFLHALLAEPAQIDAVARVVKEDFGNIIAAELYHAMQDIKAEGRPVNRTTLGAMVAPDPLGGPNILDRVLQFNGETGNAQDLADILLDHSARRSITSHCEWASDQVKNPRTKTADIAAAITQEFDGLLARTARRKPTSFWFNDAMDQTLEMIQAGRSESWISTGISDLDAMAGGLERQALHILAGRPSMGKSALGSVIATNAARQGHGVAIFSLEMTRKAWMARVASEATWENGRGIPYQNALRNSLSDQDKERLFRAATKRASLPVIIDDQPALTMAEITARTRRASVDMEAKGKQLSLVVVDHIGKIRPSKNYRGQRVYEVGEITESLAALAKNENVAVLALSQINRGVEDRENKRPQLSDLRESGNIEQDADAAWFVYRPAYYYERGKEDGEDKESVRLNMLNKTRNSLEVLVAKTRNGQIGTADLFCDMACNVVRNLDRRH